MRAHPCFSARRPNLKFVRAVLLARSCICFSLVDVHGTRTVAAPRAPTKEVWDFEKPNIIAKLTSYPHHLDERPEQLQEWLNRRIETYASWTSQRARSEEYECHLEMREPSHSVDFLLSRMQSNKLRKYKDALDNVDSLVVALVDFWAPISAQFATEGTEQAYTQSYHRNTEAIRGLMALLTDQGTCIMDANVGDVSLPAQATDCGPELYNVIFER
jgi:hypothetical protein